MRIFAFGSSLVSSYWNGAATYYRGIYRGLAELGHEITFAEPDIYERQQHRDLSEVEYANVIVYRTPKDIPDLLELASSADIVIKHSGVGAEDELLEAAVLNCRRANGRRVLVAWWDVDAPATLSRVEADVNDPFRSCIPLYDLVLTYGGGTPVVNRYLALGARHCVPVYNGLDPDINVPVSPDPTLACDLVFVGNRLPDRERRVEQLFLRAAELAPEMRFILGGEGWGTKSLPSNVRWIGHVGTGDLNRINSSARMVLNINRDSMADVGFSPPTRIFEAAGASACVVTDRWAGIESFFAPCTEVLVAASADDIVQMLRSISTEQAREIGNAMRTRAIAAHSYTLRAQQVNTVLKNVRSETRIMASHRASADVLSVDSGKVA
jgi:spore maturation protein CgeB